MPPMKPSTAPRHGRPSKVVTSLHIGAGAMRPSCIALTKWPAAKASLSTSTTGRAFGIASSMPRSSPPPPVQTLIMLRLSGRTATFTGAPPVMRIGRVSRCSADGKSVRPPSARPAALPAARAGGLVTDLGLGEAPRLLSGRRHLDRLGDQNLLAAGEAGRHKSVVVSHCPSCSRSIRSRALA